MLRCVAVLFFVFFTIPVRADGDPKAVSYEKDILPLLKAKCYSCHDAKKATSHFRLDVRSMAMAGGESEVKGIVPGKPHLSEVYRRVTLAADDNDVMPPKGEKLTKIEQEKLRDWIAKGAVWPDTLANEAKGTHWAFVAPKRPAVPVVNDAGIRNPIDAFVRAKLEKEGILPAPEADKATLIRRVYLDLIGLPPSPKQVDAFLKDDKPGAYERVVNELLQSPHYGERWARVWLDAARYADSDGFEKDKPRSVWFYRDWVINALNKDLPFDRFIIEQIGGDMLKGATQDQRVATGFLRNSMINEEGGIDPEQFRMEAMFDRMDAVGKAVLGLTIQCAQCHTHKYDPITQSEYYKLFAFLNNSHEANTIVYTPAEQQKRAELFRKMKELEEELKHKMPDWDTKLAAWEAREAKKVSPWTILRPQLDTSGGQKHTLLPDGSIIATGYAPTKHTTDFETNVEGLLTGVRLEMLNDPNLPCNGPGRSIYGSFALSEIKVEINGKAVKLASATATANPAVTDLDKQFDDKTKTKRVTGPVAMAIDGKNDTAWTSNLGYGRTNDSAQAVFVFEKPIQAPTGTTIKIKLVQMHGGSNSDNNENNNLGRFRLAVTTTPNPTVDPLPWDVQQALQYPREQRTDQQIAKTFSYWRTTIPEWKDTNEQIEALWKEHPPGAQQLVYEERRDFRMTYILKRGDFLKPDKAVAPSTPAFLHPMPIAATPNRLDFACWLVSKDSPTTARAAVNRAWQAFFGTGIVATAEDLGTQAAPPSHPELLDWLAVTFMEDQQWSLKKMHSLIVTSATYRQASTVTPALLAKDPENRLLARGSRIRVDAEVVRDIALTASGLLTPTVGGPSVFPPIPAFLMLPPASYGPKVWPEAKGVDRYKRSLYVFRFRSVPYPPLQAFDAPVGDFACVKRSRSNTPLQALTLLNEPIFAECAKALGQRVVLEGGNSDSQRIRYAFQLTVSRTPTAAEEGILLDLLAKERARGQNADAWTALGRVVLNLDETVTKE